MQEGDVGIDQGWGLPVGGHGRVKRIHREQGWRLGTLQRLQPLQAVVQGLDGQQQARLGIVDDRAQAFLVVRARGLWRVGRHRDHPGIQAAEECRHIVGTAGKQQHRTLAELRAGLQGGSDAAGALVEVTVAEHGLVARLVGEKAQGNLLGGTRGALRQGLDQRERAFEGVHHGMFLPESGKVAPCEHALGAAADGGGISRETDGQEQKLTGQAQGCASRSSWSDGSRRAAWPALCALARED